MDDATFIPTMAALDGMLWMVSGISAAPRWVSFVLIPAQIAGSLAFHTAVADYVYRRKHAGGRCLSIIISVAQIVAVFVRMSPYVAWGNAALSVVCAGAVFWRRSQRGGTPNAAQSPVSDQKLFSRCPRSSVCHARTGFPTVPRVRRCAIPRQSERPWLRCKVALLSRVDLPARSARGLATCH